MPPKGPPHSLVDTNGKPPPPPVPASAAAKVEEYLDMPFGAGYRPSLPIFSFRTQQTLGPEFFQDVEVMLTDDYVLLPLNMIIGTMGFAEWELKASDPETAKYAAELLLWFWADPLYQIMYEGCSYGWAGAEILQESRDGYLYPCSIEVFSPRDVVPIIDYRTKKPSGIQVNAGGLNERRMWGFRENVPNKAFWYTHRPRYGMRFGNSQIRPAWRPWRQAAGVDGNQEIMAIACHRLGTGVIKVYHPNTTIKATDSALPQYARARGQVHTRDIALQIAQEVKAGAGIALSSQVYDQKAGGVRQWDVLVDTFNTNIDQLMTMENQLKKKCAEAIGVPAELIAASETGSGYSGRAIPLQGFLTTRQRDLHELTKQVMAQLVMPNIKWCCGPDCWATATPKPLIKSYRKAAWGEDGEQQGQQPGQASQQTAAASAGQPPFQQGGAQAGSPA